MKQRKSLEERAATLRRSSCRQTARWRPKPVLHQTRLDSETSLIWTVVSAILDKDVRTAGRRAGGYRVCLGKVQFVAVDVWTSIDPVFGLDVLSVCRNINSIRCLCRNGAAMTQCIHCVMSKAILTREIIEKMWLPGKLLRNSYINNSPNLALTFWLLRGIP